ncbi:MAG: hypothetical protein IKO26_05910 [Paludibacteraceae bacterium]|nr:hypothetical protein [Paludibacteraceae bacterium]
MSKNRERILLKVNAIIVGLLGLLGVTSCNYLVKYGVPGEFLPNDSTAVDTLVRCMYGVAPNYPLIAPQQDDSDTDNAPEVQP